MSKGYLNILRKRKKDISKLVRSGASHLTISRFLNVSIHSVRDFCSLYSITSPYYLIGSPQKKKMLDMLKKEEPAALINKETGLSFRTIQRAASKNGYKYVKSFIPIDKRTVSKIVILLRKSNSSQQIIDRLKLSNISCRQILGIKKKYKIKGLTRGGVSSIPQDEIAYIKTLMMKGVGITDMVPMMSNKFKKPFSYEVVRGRCRMFQYKMNKVKPYDENEKKLMMKAVKEGLNVINTVPLFPSRSYSSVKKLREMTKAYVNREKFKEVV